MVWTDLLPAIWSILSERELVVLTRYYVSMTRQIDLSDLFIGWCRPCSQLLRVSGSTPGAGQFGLCQSVEESVSPQTVRKTCRFG